MNSVNRIRLLKDGLTDAYMAFLVMTAYHVATWLNKYGKVM